jgi:PAS domain S-box-containing protein
MNSTETPEQELQLLRAVFSGFPDLIGITDLKGRFLDINKVAEGYSKEKVIGTNVQEYLTAEQKKEFKEAVRQAIKTGNPQTYEPAITNPKGETIYWMNRLAPLEIDGKVRSLVINFSDITEKVKMEDDLNRSEARLRAVLDATPFPVAVVDLADEKIIYWSKSAHKLFGHTASTASEWYRIAYPDTGYREKVIKRWKDLLEDARKTGKTVNAGEYHVTCNSGSVKICELYASFTSDNLIVTFNDITDRKKAEASDKEKQRELEKFHKMAIGRELKMVELKKRIKELERMAGH